MTNFGNLGKKNLIEIIFFNLPMVAISQRTIPKDQLYENKTDQETLFRNYYRCTKHN